MAICIANGNSVANGIMWWNKFQNILKVPHKLLLTCSNIFKDFVK